jgi:osmotically-inducible protein OsmY
MQTIEKSGKSDEQLRDDVLRELEWDSRVAPIQVGVQVERGVVTLSGTVPSLMTRLAAIRAAHRVHGVLDVADEIDVALPGKPGLTDAEIARAVRHALEWDVLVDDRRIQSTVDEGVVTLEGRVETIRQSEDAAHAVRALKGVRGVVNRIEVSPSEVDPAIARRAIDRALERRAEREAERIGVSVSDGTVTLAGTVRSWAERDAIVGAVSHAPGISSVSDHLKIDPWV